MKTNRPVMLSLLASSALLVASPALADGSAAPDEHAESGWMQSAVNWVASCLPHSNGSTGAQVEPGKSGRTWWSSGAGENSEHGKPGETGQLSSLTGWFSGSHDADHKPAGAQGTGIAGYHHSEATSHHGADDGSMPGHESDGNAHHGTGGSSTESGSTGTEPTGTGSTGTGSTGMGSTGTGASTGSGDTGGATGNGNNGGFGGNLGSGDGGSAGDTGSTGSGSTGSGATGSGSTGTGSTGSTGAGNAGGAGSSTDVPEPGMIGLFAAGLIPLALRRRAKRSSVA